MRKLATAVLAAGLFFGGMGVAVADSWRDVEMKTAGAKFKGSYQWQPKGQPPSGLHLKGSLIDAEATDGHNNYLKVNIAGYPERRIKGVQKKSVQVNKVLYDQALLITREVQVTLCRDRGAFRPDNCAHTHFFKRK
ncbi:hypothetical protein [Streptomyces sp. NPDC003327]